MGISYRYAKKLAKIGAKLLIGLLVLDTAYSLVRFIIFKTAYDDILNENFLPMESIILNTFFTTFIAILASGMLMLSLYYFKYSKFGLIASLLLFLEIGIKIAFIFYQFSILLGNYNSQFITRLTEIFQMVTALLFILTFIVFSFFQIQIKKRADIGYGKSFLPYVFGFLALIYPIVNILNLCDIPYKEMPSTLAIIHMLSYIVAIIEIIMFFDLLRRFDYMKHLPEQSDESLIEVKIIKEVLAEERKGEKRGR